MRLLLLSWRYLGHPKAGGAEVFTHEILRRLAGRGYEVTAFTGADPSVPRESVIDGVRVLRAGQQWTVHVQAYRWLRSRLDGFDRVLDQINTIPFFTPGYVPSWQRRGWIHQLAREYWWRETRGAFRAIAPVGFASEPLYLQAYRRTQMLCLSQSTVDDLHRLGVRDTTIVPAAIDAPVLAQLPSDTPGFTVVMLSRLTPAKYIEEGVLAFARLLGRRPDAELVIAGSGDDRYAAKLRALVGELGIGERVQFAGRISEAAKRELLQRAHVHLFTSHREGWGLVVTEAGAVGTPSVGYDAPGVRDSVADPRLLAPLRDHAALGDRMVALAGDPALYRDVRRGAWERAALYTYETATARFLEAIT